MAERAAVKLPRGEWSQPQFAEIARSLHETAGLVFPWNRRESAESGMRRAMAATCISDANDFQRAIVAAGEVRDILITELTIGETFFLREQGQFDFLRQTVLPEMRANIAPRALRMWSAGCATGEEPYSLAMTLREAAWPGPATILGTDLAFARLVAARRARYTAWSMRGVSHAMVTKYFEQQGKHFILNADVRKPVEFRVLNLASAEYPSPGSGVEQMDVIFCRNVLIYFDLSTVAAIANRLIASLAPGGWLFLGASDPPIAEFIPCEVVLTGAGLAYRPPGTTSETPQQRFAGVESWGDSEEPDAVAVEETLVADSALEAPIAFPESDSPTGQAAPPEDETDSIDSCESAYEQGDYDAAIRLARLALASGNDTEAIRLVLVRSLANRGHLDAAGEACADALDRFRLSTELTHMHAILLAEAGRYPEAGAAAKQALYLNPRYTVAHLALGDALSRTGDTVSARRSFRNAEMLLEGLAPNTPVPGGDGAEAGQLLRIARFRIETMRTAAKGGVQ